jgi:hypothetical protein
MWSDQDVEDDEVTDVVYLDFQIENDNIQKFTLQSKFLCTHFTGNLTRIEPVSSESGFNSIKYRIFVVYLISKEAVEAVEAGSFTNYTS